jgi:hypothetical protein
LPGNSTVVRGTAVKIAKKFENGEAATVGAGGALRPFGAATAQVAVRSPMVAIALARNRALARKRNCIANPRMLGGSQNLSNA